MSMRISLIVLIGALACASGTALAQIPEQSAVTGTVTAPDGARLPDVTLALTNLETGAVARATTNDVGMFRAGGLAPGRYVVEAVLRGFEPLVVSDVTVAAGQTLSLPLEVRVATLRESVQVIGRSTRNTVEASALRESRARDVGEALASMPGLSKIRKDVS